MLTYFAEPDLLLRRLLERVLPGGVVAFHEIDVHGATCEPNVPLYARTIARLIQTLRCVNANPRMGLHLSQTFQRVSLPTPRMIAHARIGTAAEVQIFQQITAVTRTLLPAMETHGIATAAEVDVDTLAERMQRAMQAANATVVAPLFVGAWAHKP